MEITIFLTQVRIEYLLILDNFMRAILLGFNNTKHIFYNKEK